jgi:hypothetical protein
VGDPDRSTNHTESTLGCTRSRGPAVHARSAEPIGCEVETIGKALLPPVDYDGSVTDGAEGSEVETTLHVASQPAERGIRPLRLPRVARDCPQSLPRCAAEEQAEPSDHGDGPALHRVHSRVHEEVRAVRPFGGGCPTNPRFSAEFRSPGARPRVRHARCTNQGSNGGRDGGAETDVHQGNEDFLHTL